MFISSFTDDVADNINETSTSSGFVSLPNIEKYKSEAARLATFDAWTYPLPAPKDLAKCVLCYLGQTDAVQCTFCTKIILDWRPEYLPKKVHKDMSPDCPFMKGQDVGNIPLVKPDKKSPLSTSGMYEQHDS